MLGKRYENCIDTCESNNMNCTEQETWKHREEVDTSDEVILLLENELGVLVNRKPCDEHTLCKPFHPFYGEGTGTNDGCYVCVSNKAISDERVA